MNDATTFFLAFAAVFAGIATLLWHLERRAKALEARLATLETAVAAPGMAADPATAAIPGVGAATTAKAKASPEEGGRKA